MSEELLAATDDNIKFTVPKLPMAKLHFRFLKQDDGEKSTHNLSLAPEDFNGIHEKVVTLADIYAEIKSAQGYDMPSQFMEFRRKYAEEAPQAGKTWYEHVVAVASKICTDFHLADVELNGSKIEAAKKLEDFLDENGIVLIVLPQSKEIENLDGFATTFLGIPIIALAQKADKDYRRMFFTSGHELYHLLFAEGEDLANSFPGRLFMPKEKFQPFIKNPKDLEKDMPELLKAFPYNSAWSIANTAKSYGLISEEERASWNHNKQKKRTVHKKMHTEPYQWHSRVEQFKDVKPKEVDSELYENYLKALNAIS